MVFYICQISSIIKHFCFSVHSSLPPPARATPGSPWARAPAELAPRRPSWWPTRTLSGMMRCSPTSGRSRRSLAGYVWKWRGSWSVAQRVILMTHSLMEMAPLKGAKVPEAKKSLVSVLSWTITLRKQASQKDAYKKYIKDDLRSVKQKLGSTETRKVKPFMAGATEQIKSILTDFKNHQSFTGGNTNPMVVLLDLWGCCDPIYDSL